MARRSKTIVGLDIEPAPSPPYRWPPPTASPSSVPRVADLDPHVVRDGEVTDGEALTDGLRALWSQNSWLDRKVRIGVANRASSSASWTCRRWRTSRTSRPRSGSRPRTSSRWPLDQAVLDFQSLGLVETARRPAPPRPARRGPPRHDRAPAGGPRRRPAPRGRRPLRLRHGPRPQASRTARCSTSPSAASRTSRSPRTATASSPASRRRPGGHGRRPRRAPGPDAGPRPRLAAPRRPGHPARRGRRRAAIIEDARAVLTDGARRIAADVRASLDFHHTQSAGLPMVERVLLTGPAVTVPGFAEPWSASSGCRSSRGVTPTARPTWPRR